MLTSPSNKIIAEFDYKWEVFRRAENSVWLDAKVELALKA
jgi:hypothetical protein